MQDIEIQEIFARLTAQFEDCATLSAAGQRFGLSREEARELLREILEIGKVAEQSLSQVEQYLDS